MKNEKKIIVGIDVRDLQIAKTGQRTVIEELCKQFKKIDNENFRFVFFDSSFPVYTGKNKLLLIFEHLRFQCWKQIILPVKAWQNNCSILFCGDYFSPYFRLGFKTIVIFHDAFFFQFPKHYNPIWLSIFRYTAIPAAKKCSYIMTVTNFASKKIQLFTTLPKEKFVTIHPGGKSLPPDNNSFLLPNSLQEIVANKYILHIGVFEKRKNLPALVHAFNKLKEAGHSDLKLVLVGKGNGKTYSDDTEQIQMSIRKFGLEKEVLFPGHLSDQQLSIFYKNAFMYVFPSINEGFGLPVLEAFSFSLPVIVANNSSLPEVGGDAVLSFDPFTVDDLYLTMKQVLEDEKLRLSLIEKGKKRLEQFSWEKATDHLLTIFKKAVNE